MVSAIEPLIEPMPPLPPLPPPSPPPLCPRPPHSFVHACTTLLGSVLQLLEEMTSMTVEQESMNTKNQLMISSYEGHLGSLGTSLKKAECVSEEQAHLIKNLKSTKEELVSQ